MSWLFTIKPHLMHLKNAGLLLQVRDYIDSNLHRNLPIATLCREFNTNKTSLQERFRSYCGVSLHAFLLQSRMAKAEALLRETDDPVKYVAMQCGYRKVHSFNKAFKSYWQLSPGAYRKTSLPDQGGIGAVKSNINVVKSYTA